MYEGKERRRQLIQELRTTHALQSPEQKIKKQEAEVIEKKQLQERRLLHKVGHMCVCVSVCVCVCVCVYIYRKCNMYRCSSP